MKETFELFDNRRDEVLFYYKILEDFDKNMPTNLTGDDFRFFKIMKSNFILMIYNLVESCIVSGMTEIYNSLYINNCNYLNVIEEIKQIWIKNEVRKIYNPSATKDTYIKKIREIIETVINNTTLKLTKECLDGNIDGNLDAKRIRELCERHHIRHRAKDREGSLLIIKERRNDLAHGEKSFSDCARDLTTTDLEKIMNDTILFINKILEGMEKYYNDQSYMKNDAAS